MVPTLKEMHEKTLAEKLRQFKAKHTINEIRSDEDVESHSALVVEFEKFFGSNEMEELLPSLSNAASVLANEMTDAIERSPFKKDIIQGFRGKTTEITVAKKFIDGLKQAFRQLPTILFNIETGQKTRGSWKGKKQAHVAAHEEKKKKNAEAWAAHESDSAKQKAWDEWNAKQKAASDAYDKATDDWKKSAAPGAAPDPATEPKPEDFMNKLGPQPPKPAGIAAPTDQKMDAADNAPNLKLNQLLDEQSEAKLRNMIDVLLQKHSSDDIWAFFNKGHGKFVGSSSKTWGVNKRQKFFELADITGDILNLTTEQVHDLAKICGWSGQIGKVGSDDPDEQIKAQTKDTSKISLGSLADQFMKSREERRAEIEAKKKEEEERRAATAQYGQINYPTGASTGIEGASGSRGALDRAKGKGKQAAASPVIDIDDLRKIILKAYSQVDHDADVGPKRIVNTTKIAFADSASYVTFKKTVVETVAGDIADHLKRLGIKITS